MDFINPKSQFMASPFDLTRLQIPLILEYHSMVCFRPTLASWILGEPLCAFRLTHKINIIVVS